MTKNTHFPSTKTSTQYYKTDLYHCLSIRYVYGYLSQGPSEAAPKLQWVEAVIEKNGVAPGQRREVLSVHLPSGARLEIGDQPAGGVGCGLASGIGGPKRTAVLSFPMWLYGDQTRPMLIDDVLLSVEDPDRLEKMIAWQAEHEAPQKIQRLRLVGCENRRRWRTEPGFEGVRASYPGRHRGIHRSHPPRLGRGP